MPASTVCAPLLRDIDLARRILADEDDGEARARAVAAPDSAFTSAATSARTSAAMALPSMTEWHGTFSPWLRLLVAHLQQRSLPCSRCLQYLEPRPLTLSDFTRDLPPP